MIHAALEFKLVGDNNMKQVTKLLNSVEKLPQRLMFDRMADMVHVRADENVENWHNNNDTLGESEYQQGTKNR